MDTKKLSLTIVFTALAIVLNPTLSHIQLAFPLVPGLYYQIWEIPIIIALLIISPISSIAVSLLNTIVLFALFPGNLPTGPLYNLLATLSMQIGIYITISIGKKIYTHKKPQTNILTSIKWLTITTATGILTRITFMTIILYFTLPQNPPIGYGYSQIVTNASLPLVGLFNASLALYTIPIAWLIAQRVQQTLRLPYQTQIKQNNTKKS
ncbi:MAG: hypothetical protein FWH37_04140 [Candidatus Bathyarchaeota archaeon]|nr:hypothetical protein [Candidatus Termiticorpusculum sp.]